MSWDEALFGAAWNGARRFLAPRASSEVLTRRVELEPERERLELLARLLTSAPMTVTLSDEVGGYRGDVLYLPRHLDAATRELSLAAPVARVAWACSSRALGFVKPDVSGSDELMLATALAAPATRRRLLDDAPMLAQLLLRLEGAALQLRPTPPAELLRAQCTEAVVRLALGATAGQPGLEPAAWAWAETVLFAAPARASTLAEVLRHLPPRPPATRRWLRAAFRSAPVWLWGELMSPISRMAAASTPKPGDDASALPGGTEAQKKVVTQPQRLEEPKDQLAENPLVHSFEKVHTLETYKGGSKRIDGDDELAAHKAALEELDLKQLVRSHQRARSLYRADVFNST